MDLKVFTEAGQQKGIGHFARMSSICERLIYNNKNVIMYLEADDITQELLKRKYVEFIDWIENNKIIDCINKNDIVLIDSYHVDIAFLKKVQKSCKKLFVIDDNIRLDYENMTIINPNYFGEYLDYPKDKGNAYFVGKNYTLLRREFVPDENRIINKKVKKILITLGGTDVLGLTDQIIDETKKFDDSVELNVVVTEAFNNLNTIKEKIRKKDNLYIGATAKEMSELMRNVDFAIASAGGTSNELIKMQCPSILVVVADNQQKNCDILSQKGYFETMNIYSLQRIRLMFDYEKRCSIFKVLKLKKSKRTATDLFRIGER